MKRERFDINQQSLVGLSCLNLNYSIEIREIMFGLMVSNIFVEIRKEIWKFRCFDDRDMLLL